MVSTTHGMLVTHGGMVLIGITVLIGTMARVGILVGMVVITTLGSIHGLMAIMAATMEYLIMVMQAGTDHATMVILIMAIPIMGVVIM